MTAEPIPPSREAKAARINLRASAKQDALIRRAAVSAEQSVTEFILESALRAAEQVLADRRFFEVSPASWRAFNKVLDRPAVLKPRLRKLLAEESSFAEIK